MSKIKGVSDFTHKSIWHLDDNLMGCIAKLFKCDIQRPLVSCVPKISEIEGVVQYPNMRISTFEFKISAFLDDASQHPSWVTFRRQTYSCVPKNERNCRGRRFLPTDLFGL